MTGARDVLRRLEALGSEQTRKTYGRFGVPPPLFGVKYGDLYALRKQLGRDQALAAALWQSGIHDARVLAAMIADPAAFDLEMLRAWQSSTTCGVQSDALITYVATPIPAGKAALQAWLDDPAEPQRRAGWTLVAHLAKDDPDLEDSFFAAHVATIEKQIHRAPNWVRDAMNRALIAIGARSDGLAELAVAAAKRIGPLEIDYGDTDCKTPDAASYIVKARAHQAKKAAKKAPAKQVAKAAPAKKVAKKAPAKKVTKATPAKKAAKTSTRVGSRA